MLVLLLVKNSGLMPKQMKMESTSLDLPDGEYQMDGVWVESESKWYPFVVSFKVQDGAVKS